jgi:hypothetical protein
MTAKRDLKKRIRERAARTGESYTAARRHVVGGPRAPAVPFIEMRDLSEEAARVGLRCPVRIFPDLALRIDCAATLERIRDALRATGSDPATELMRAVALRGEQPEGDHAFSTDPVRYPPIKLVARGPAEQPLFGPFLTRVRAGIGGVSEGGRMLALAVAGRRGLEMVVCCLALTPLPPPLSRPAALVLMSPDDAIIEVP